MLKIAFGSNKSQELFSVLTLQRCVSFGESDAMDLCRDTDDVKQNVQKSEKKVKMQGV